MSVAIDRPVKLGVAVRHPDLLGTIDWRPSQLELLDTLDGRWQLHLWACSRQSGKSTMAQAAATQNAALRPDLDDVLPHGKWRSVPVIAPSESQAKDFAGGCAALIEASPALAEYAEIRVGEVLFRLPREDAHGHRWTAKTAIRAMPASAPSIRGLTSALVVCEEFAHHADAGGPSDERRIWDAVGPMQTVFGAKAKVLGISTPYGESGLFAELFAAIEGGLMPHAQAVRRSITEMIPDIDPAWLEARRLELGETAYAQEFEAAFVGSGGSFFSLEGVEFLDEKTKPEDGRRWIAGLDPAFHGDKFGVAIIGESVKDPGVFVAGDLEGIAPGGKLKSLDLRRGREDKTLARVWDLLRPYHEEGGGLRIVTDQHQSDSVKSYFGRLGVAPKSVTLTGPLQTAAFTSLRTRLQDGSLRLWKQQALIEELRRVRARDSETIHLPRFGGSHCDIASAAALACYELRNASGEPQALPRGGERLIEKHGSYSTVGNAIDKVF